MRLILFLLSTLLVSPMLAQTDKAYQKELKKYRKAYKLAFKQNPNGPLPRKAIKRLDFFDANTTYQIEADLELSQNEQPFKMATYDGKAHPYIKYGVASFVLKGDSIQLVLYRSLAGFRMPNQRNKLFLPFKDSTNDEQTYGGGRYIDLTINEIKEGKIIIDFNKAYNPYCAYGDGWSCPIPPNENHLDMPILAGEKLIKEK